LSFFITFTTVLLLKVFISPETAGLDHLVILVVDQQRIKQESIVHRRLVKDTLFQCRDILLQIHHSKSFVVVQSLELRIHFHAITETIFVGSSLTGFL
jgi:hypothetical protein